MKKQNDIPQPIRGDEGATVKSRAILKETAKIRTCLFRRKLIMVP